MLASLNCEHEENDTPNNDICSCGNCADTYKTRKTSTKTMVTRMMMRIIIVKIYI